MHLRSRIASGAMFSVREGDVHIMMTVSHPAKIQKEKRLVSTQRLFGTSIFWVQEAELRKLYGAHKKERGYLRTIANEMPGNFTKSRIKTHLRKLGLKLQVRHFLSSKEERLDGRSFDLDWGKAVII